MSRITQRKVTITNGVETREVTRKVAESSKILGAHGWKIASGLGSAKTTQPASQNQETIEVEEANLSELEVNMADEFEAVSQEEIKPVAKTAGRPPKNK